MGNIHQARADERRFRRQFGLVVRLGLTGFALLVAVQALWLASGQPLAQALSGIGAVYCIIMGVFAVLEHLLAGRQEPLAEPASDH